MQTKDKRQWTGWYYSPSYHSITIPAPILFQFLYFWYHFFKWVKHCNLIRLVVIFPKVKIKAAFLQLRNGKFWSGIMYTGEIGIDFKFIFKSLKKGCGSSYNPSVLIADKRIQQCFRGKFYTRVLLVSFKEKC